MRILTALSVLFISLSSAPAFADLITPDLGTNDEDAGATTNNGTNAATNNGTTAANNGTAAGNNSTGGETGGGTETTGGETTKTDDGGCATASGAENLLPALMGVALIGLTRRRR